MKQKLDDAISNLVPVQEKKGISAGTVAKGILAAVVAVGVIFVGYKAWQFATSPLPGQILGGLTYNPFGSTGGLGNTPSLPNLGGNLGKSGCSVEQYFASLSRNHPIGYASYPPRSCVGSVYTPGGPTYPPPIRGQGSSYSGGYTNRGLVQCYLTGGYVNPSCIDPASGVSYQAESLYGICAANLLASCPFGSGCLPYQCGPNICNYGGFGCNYGICFGSCPGGGQAYQCPFQSYCSPSVCYSGGCQGFTCLSSYSCTVFCAGSGCFI